ncbi:MAG: Flp pilus assembly complex ATPase component TadA [Parasporobacterium sp.]|nr:Flp pilus assembly complex ATPase component TadA [Parasporobacterium sp.]
MAIKRLGELLISAGKISEEDLERGLALQKESKERLGTVLIENGIITETDLIDALTTQLGVKYIDLSSTVIPGTMSKYVPKNLAKKYNVIPVKLVNDELYLAMSDPLNFYAIEEVRKASRKRIVPMVADIAGINYAMQMVYGNERASQAIEEMQRERSDSDDEQEGGLHTFYSSQTDDDPLSSAPTIRLVNSIIERAVTERASDIHLEPRENEMQVRMRIDGVLHNILTIPKELQRSVISRIKVMSGMDIAERRIPQDGRFNIHVGEKEYDVRISSLPTIFGEKIVGRLLNKGGGNASKETIGLQGGDLEKYERMIKSTEGVVLIVGPTGSGKSTTMYAMINELNKEGVNLVTLEDPVEYHINGINQVQINEKTGMTFANGLRSILRQDPDIIAVGEIRDGETADIAMRSAITGHVVLSTLHTNDAVGAIDRLEDMGVEPYLISSALKGVISQRLLRRICPNCKESYDASEDEKDQLGIPLSEPVKLYRGVGCAHCFNTGFQGRIGVFEILYLTRAVKNVISRKGNREEIEALIKHDRKNFITIRENAIRLVLDGTTTFSEAVRVIGLEGQD